MPTLLLMALSTIVSAEPAKGAFTVRQIFFEVQREPDGKKYPNQVKESFTLTADGALTYSAYFGGMPIEMNHMDSATWKSGEAGAKVMETLRAVLRDAALSKEVVLLPDDAPSPFPDARGVYVIGLTKNHADSSYVLPELKGKARAKIHAAFQELIAQFEKATGRPKKPEDLPQR